MRWPPQSPWATSGCERVPLSVDKGASGPPRPQWRGPVSPACGRGEAALGSGEGLSVADCVPAPPSRLRAGVPPPPRPGLPSLPPLPPFLPSSLSSLFSRPSPSPSPCPAAERQRLEEKGFRRIFIKSSLLRGITNRIRAAATPPLFWADNISRVLKGLQGSGLYLDRILSLPWGAWPPENPRPLPTRPAGSLSATEEVLLLPPQASAGGRGGLYKRRRDRKPQPSHVTDP